MFRILPFLIILLMITFSSRLVEFIADDQSFSLMQELMAAEEGEEAKEENKDGEEGDKEEKPEEGEKKEDGDMNEEKPEEGEKKEEMDKAEEKGGGANEAKDEDEEDEAAKMAKMFSDTELEVLQGLAKRREILDIREEDLALRESVLMTIEQNIDKKIMALKQLQKDVQMVLDEYNAKEDMKIKGLVKVYESMKPQDAATIFADLEMEILLPVASNMKEAKLALVLSKMDAIKARELTIQIANRRRLARDKIDMR